MSELPLRTAPLVGRRSVLRLFGIAAVGFLVSCRSGKQRAAPASGGPSTTAAPSRSPEASASAPPSSASTAPTASASPEPTVSAPSADELVAQRVATAEEALLAVYDAISDAHPELAGRLAPFRADHAAHLHGLVPGAAPATTSSSSTPPAQPSAPLSSPPTSTQIFQQLAQAERNAAVARLNDVAATSGSLARLIASIGGCEAAHAALLLVAT